MDEQKNPIAENISSLRLAAGYTQADLAEMLGYTDKAVSKWERAESVPDVFVLKKIADLFGVTVDYMLTTHNTAEVAAPKKKKHNQLIITLLSVALVWFLATFAYVVGCIVPASMPGMWLAFVAAVPVSCILLIIFNSIWGKKKYNFIFISGLVWSTLAFVYLLLLDHNYWLIFMIGIPAQAIILLWSRLRTWTSGKFSAKKGKK
ncbi:MAG: helix-turn-helix domain-containing protein [Eubacteriales bacterium]